MKSLNKKLYSVIFICLLTLCFTLSVMATNASNSTGSTGSVVSTSTSNEQGGTESTSSGNGEGDGNTDASGDLSSELTDSDLSSESGEGAESDESGASESDLTEGPDISSGEDMSSDESVTSDTDSNGNTTSKKRPSNHGNVGGVVSDEADTSGWGDEETETSSLVSAGTTEKKDNKNITNYSSVLWILIWIPILLIIGSVVALVYVNRKSFLEGEDDSLSDGNEKPKKRRLSAAEKTKRKNNHRNRTNIYRPRD